MPWNEHDDDTDEAKEARVRDTTHSYLGPGLTRDHTHHRRKGVLRREEGSGEDTSLRSARQRAWPADEKYTHLAIVGAFWKGDVAESAIDSRMAS